MPWGGCLAAVTAQKFVAKGGPRTAFQVLIYPVVDDGKAYADKLEAAGVAVTHQFYPGQVHGFISLSKVIPQGAAALRGIADWLKQRL